MTLKPKVTLEQILASFAEGEMPAEIGSDYALGAGTDPHRRRRRCDTATVEELRKVIAQRKRARGS